MSATPRSTDSTNALARREPKPLRVGHSVVVFGFPLLLFGLFVIGNLIRAQGPILTLATVTNDQMQLTLHHADLTNAYAILRRDSLEGSIVGWQFHMWGSAGQTVFTITNSGSELSGFFQAISGHDWDGDRVPNWEDAKPFDGSVGRLSVTIDYPLEGTTLN